MIFGDNKKWSPIRWLPIHTQILRLHWEGKDTKVIADSLQVALDLVRNVIKSDHGEELLASLDAKTFDSMLEVHTLIQAHAPDLIQRKLALAYTGSTEAIRSKNISELLQMAGHVPVHKVVIERPDPILDKYKDKTPDMLRNELLKFKDSATALDDVGPDGKLVN